jgi:transcriptional regulator with GAF, ATPase, and Fis domain
MKELTLSAEQTALVTALPDVHTAVPTAPLPLDDHETLLSMPLTEAKRLAAASFERRYLVRVMETANGSVSEGARLAGLDRTNFRRLLHRHGLR